MRDPAALLGLPLGEAQAVLRLAGEAVLQPVYTFPTRIRSGMVSLETVEPRVLRADCVQGAILLTVAAPLGSGLLQGAEPC